MASNILQKVKISCESKLRVCSPVSSLTAVFSVSVQHECIPQAILGMDIVCQAKSGMGKTAVFVLATLQQLEPVDGQVRASAKVLFCLRLCLSPALIDTGSEF